MARTPHSHHRLLLTFFFLPALAGAQTSKSVNCSSELPRFQAALEAAEKQAPGEVKSAAQQSALKQIADCQVELGNLDAAETALWRRKDVLTAWRGAQSAAVADNYHELAFIQIQRQAWGRAERWALEAVVIYDALLAKVLESQASAANSQGAARNAPKQTGMRANVAREVNALNGSKVAALYTWGLAIALQKRTDEALKIWETAYVIGEQLKPPPKVLLQIAQQAIELHDMTGRRAGRDVWVARMRKIRNAK